MRKAFRWFGVYSLVIILFLLITYGGSKAVSVFSESPPSSQPHYIIIDPGHGGEDGGTTSCTGRLESAYNLEIARRLHDLFQLLGYETRLTRTEDISIYTEGETLGQKKRSDLKERVRITTERENSILLSIHQNHYPDSKYYGPQVFYADTPGSRELAEKLQNAFTADMDHGSSRGAKKSSGIYLMEHILCTGVLIECGFLSNPEESAKLETASYQKKVCSIIATSVSEYIEHLTE